MVIPYGYYSGSQIWVHVQMDIFGGDLWNSCHDLFNKHASFNASFNKSIVEVNT